MGDVLEFRRPDPKRNWRKGKEYTYNPDKDRTVLPSGASISNKASGAFGEMPESAKQVLQDQLSSFLGGPVVVQHPQIFEEVKKAIGNHLLYSTFLEILTKQPSQARAKTLSSEISYFMVRDEDEPGAILKVTYSTGHEVQYDFIGHGDVPKGEIPKIGKVPVIDVAPPLWIKTDPFLILVLQDILITMNGISPISMLQDKTALQYSVVFNTHRRTRMNVTIRKK